MIFHHHQENDVDLLAQDLSVAMSLRKTVSHDLVDLVEFHLTYVSFYMK